MQPHSSTSLRWLPAAAVTAFMVIGLTTAGCRFAPKDEPGDTVAAAEFMPVDTSSAAYKAKHPKKTTIAKDSSDIFYIGEGSDRRMLRLISYPSKKDTIEMKRKRKLDVYGRSDAGRLVKIIWETDARGDTVVTEMMELELKQ